VIPEMFFAVVNIDVLQEEKRVEVSIDREAEEICLTHRTGRIGIGIAAREPTPPESRMVTTILIAEQKFAFAVQKSPSSLLHRESLDIRWLVLRRFQ